MDTVTKIGDDAGVNKHLLHGMYREINDSDYSWLSLHSKGNMKKPQLS